MTSMSPDYFRNHARVIKTFGHAKEYQCVLCFDVAFDWAHLWRTHPDKTDPYSYAPMCRSDHMSYDKPQHNTEKVKASSSATISRLNQDPEFRRRRSEGASRSMKARMNDPEYRAKMSGAVSESNKRRGRRND